jgi:hypothetical protein
MIALHLRTWYQVPVHSQHLGTLVHGTYEPILITSTQTTNTYFVLFDFAAIRIKRRPAEEDKRVLLNEPNMKRLDLVVDRSNQGHKSGSSACKFTIHS